MSAIVEVVSSSQDTLPVCLWQENPNRLVSLLDMLPFVAYNFCRASSLLGQVHSQIQSGVTPTESSWSLVAGELGMLELACEQLALTNTLAQIRRVKPIFFDGATRLNFNNFARDVLEVQVRMTDELKARTLFILSAEEAPYFADHHFGPSVAQRFPDALFDMDEAAKCFALERPTACVFHLMRITEHGLRAIGDLLKLEDPLGPNWDQVIKKIGAELKLDYKDRKFKGQADLLSHISTHLHAVKVAWRDPTMHVDKKHTTQEAREIYNATCGLMRYLAENLP
jgi:hypothetical protein